MRLREVRVRNFRNLTDIAVPIGDTTILVGENNTGKTALLDALRIALPRSAAGRTNPFDDYDYHMSKKTDSLESSEGITIELWFREDVPDEWPDSLIQALSEIIQTDLVADIDSVGFRLTSSYDPTAKDVVHKREFLRLDGQPLPEKYNTPTYFNRFYSYVRLFYLSALRDSNDEFSPRSQYWGRILRDLKIGDEKTKLITKELTKLNAELLNADPRLSEVSDSLNKIHSVVSVQPGKYTSIQPLPIKPWDLMSKSEVVIRPYGSEIDLPMSRYGQGTQSLAVLFLFESYIDLLLKPTFQPETDAILALEEPETHLHPQAARALAKNLHEMKSQMVISSHCPYFIQEIPLEQIRMFRRNGAAAQITYLKRSFSVKLPETAALSEFCKQNSARYSYNSSTSVLSLVGKMSEKEYRKLLIMYPGKPDLHSDVKRMYSESQWYLTDDEISDLETYAKRVRGEVFFARAWLLCEGQSEYVLLRYFADVLDKSLDNEGITVVDFQNNGSPGAFIGLAKALGIPWIMFCDNDDACEGFIKQAKNCGLTKQELDDLVRPLPTKGEDWETFLFKNGFREECIAILKNAALPSVVSNGGSATLASAYFKDTKETYRVDWDGNNEFTIEMADETGNTRMYTSSDADFASLFERTCVAELQKDKVGNAIGLADGLRIARADASRVPPFIRQLIIDAASKVV